MRTITEEVLLEWPLAKVTRESDGHKTVIRKVVHPQPFDYIRQCVEIDSYASSLGVTPTWLGVDAEERSFLFEDLGSLGGDEVLAEGSFDVIRGTDMRSSSPISILRILLRYISRRTLSVPNSKNCIDTWNT